MIVQGGDEEQRQIAAVWKGLVARPDLFGGVDAGEESRVQAWMNAGATRVFSSTRRG